MLANMVVCVEQHVEWIGDLLTYLRDHGHTTVEPTWRRRTRGWKRSTASPPARCTPPTCNSWYLGDNIPGKTRVFLPYVAGLHNYVDECDRVVAAGYEGFEFS